MADFRLAPWTYNPEMGNYQGRDYVPPPVNKTITINGSGFGGGPNVVLFDQFIGEDRAPAFRTPDVGEWDSISTYVAGVPKLYYDAGTGRTWLSGRDPDNLDQDSWNMAALFKYFGEITEFRFSHRAWLPVGKIFPAALTAGTFPAASSWKMSWLGISNAERNDLIGTGEPHRNVCVPSHIGNGAIAVDGNSNAPNPKPYADFSFTKPTMYSYYQSGAGTAGVFDQTVELLHVNDVTSALVLNPASDPFYSASGTFNTRNYDSMRFPGWFTRNEASWVDVVPLNADVYMAVGANSRASLYVSNAATIATSSEVYHCYPIIWTGTQIQTVIEDFNDFNENTHMHIEKADGTWLEDVAFTRS